MPRKSSLQHAPSSFYSSTSSLMQEAQRQIQAQQQIQMNREDLEVLNNLAVELVDIEDQLNAVLKRYSPLMDEILQRIDPEARIQAFLHVADHLFCKGITTLSILLLMYFSYKLVKRYFLNKMKKNMEQYLGTKVTNFILLVGAFLFKVFLKCRILTWLNRNGGWKILLSSFNWGGLAVCAGALAVCAGLLLIGFGLWKMSSSH